MSDPSTAVMRRSRTQSAAVGITSKLPSPRPVPLAISPARMRGMYQLRTVRKAEDSQGRRAWSTSTSRIAAGVPEQLLDTAEGSL